MEGKTRSEYSAKNAAVAVISKICEILMGYMVRVVFTHTLSPAYVGVGGLFTDIINILAVTELGVGTAITYALYLPIKEGDIEKQKSLMKLFARFYHTVAFLVFGLGLLLVPFLPYLVKGGDEVSHITLIYVLFLVNASASYLMIYKSMLIEAHQMLYINVIYRTIAWIIQDIIQIVILITTGNFILYLLVSLVATVTVNYILSRKAERMFSYLRDRDVQRLPDAESEAIFKNIRAMMIHKVGDVVVNNTDNLIISSMVGVVSAGLYSNYYLIIGSVKGIIQRAVLGVSASVGNLGASEKGEAIKRVFLAGFFICQWMYGVCAIIIFETINPFVRISFGERYVFDERTVLVLVLCFYITGMKSAIQVFRDSLGLFWYDRYKAIPEAVINLVVSVFLSKSFGVAGVFMGTIISNLLTSFWVEPLVLYKYRIGESVRGYFLKYGIYSGVFALTFLMIHRICGLIHGGDIFVMIIRGMVSATISGIILFFVYCRTDEVKLIWGMAKAILEKRFRR